MLRFFLLKNQFNLWMAEISINVGIINFSERVHLKHRIYAVAVSFIYQ